VLTIRRDRDIHREEGGWFTARWHFSFDHYHDPHWMGVGPLRVFNHDRLVPGAVWPMHPHADIEGITYVWRGTFRHADSLGNNGMLHPGAVQLMSLGSGALHSEQNGSATEPMEFLQLWILPDTASLPPGVQQRQFSKADRTDRLLKVVGSEPGDPILVRQNASVHVAALSPGIEVRHELGQDRAAYLYLIEGSATVNESPLSTGDAAVAQQETALAIRAETPSELILVDLPARYQPVGVWARD